MKSNVSIVQKKEGKTLGVAGGNYRVIISGEETAQAYAVIEMVVPPGGGPPPHSHPEMQEMFYVLEGEVEFKTEDGKAVVSQGGFVNIPLGGAIHYFKNTSGSVARLLCTVVPAGLERMFEIVGAPAPLGEFLPPAEMTEDRKKLLKELDETFKQTTYPMGYLG